MHQFLLCVIVGIVIGLIFGWMARGDENRRYHRRSMAAPVLAPLPPTRVVAWIPRGGEVQHLDPERRTVLDATCAGVIHSRRAGNRRV